MQLLNYQYNTSEKSNYVYNINEQGNTFNYIDDFTTGLRKSILAGSLILSLCISINNTPLVNPVFNSDNDRIYTYNNNNNKTLKSKSYDNNMNTHNLKDIKVTVLGNNEYIVGESLNLNMKIQEVTKMKQNILQNKIMCNISYDGTLLNVEINDLIEIPEKISFSELKTYKKVPISTRFVGKMPSKPIV